MIPVLRHQGTTLLIDNTPLQTHAVAETYLTAEGTAAASTLTVKNIIGFAINQILLIEDIGGENAEVILTHASTVPSGTTVTLASALVKTHPVGSKVRVILYNQFELSRATTATGSKTVLTVATTTNANPPSSLGSGLVAVDPTVKVQSVSSVEHTSGYYFSRYYDSIHTAFGSYTDALIYGGWATNTVGYMIQQALGELSLTLGDVITRYNCYAWLNECLKFVQGKQIRWPGMYEFNYIAGQTSRGTNVLTMPTNAYDTETIRSMVAMRIGDNVKVTFVDPVDYEERVGAVYTQVTTQATSGQTTLAIDNSYDFADSGSVNVYISGTKYNITYTGVTRSASAGVLTGVPSSGTGSISVTIPVDTYVWQNEEEGKPQIATVKDGVIEYYPLPDASYDNLNIALDYALIVTDVNSDGDTIEFQRFDMASWYLKWRMRMAARNDNKLDQTDSYYLMYKEALNDAIRTSPTEVSSRRAPRVNTMNRGQTSWRTNNNTTTSD
jgi:hypothetical protein